MLWLKEDPAVSQTIIFGLIRRALVILNCWMSPKLKWDPPSYIFWSRMALVWSTISIPCSISALDIIYQTPTFSRQSLISISGCTPNGSRFYLKDAVKIKGTGFSATILSHIYLRPIVWISTPAIRRTPIVRSIFFTGSRYFVTAFRIEPLPLPLLPAIYILSPLLICSFISLIEGSRKPGYLRVTWSKSISLFFGQPSGLSRK